MTIFSKENASCFKHHEIRDVYAIFRIVLHCMRMWINTWIKLFALYIKLNTDQKELQYDWLAEAEYNKKFIKNVNYVC